MPEQLNTESQVASAREALKKLHGFVDAMEARSISPSSAEAAELDDELGFSQALEELQSFFEARTGASATIG